MAIEWSGGRVYRAQEKAPIVGSKLWVEFAARRFGLTWTDVAKDDPEWQVMIPWLDGEQENGELGQAIAHDMRPQIKALGLDLVIRPPSTKLESMANALKGLLVQDGYRKRVMMLARTRNINQIPEGLKEYATAYYPVTSLDEPGWLYPEQALDVFVIRSVVDKAGKIGFIDDVYSLGGTSRGIRALVAKVAGWDVNDGQLAAKIPGVVAMLEGPFENGQPPAIPDGIHPLIVAEVVRVKREN